VNLNVNFNILKQFNCPLVGQINDLITSRWHGANVKKKTCCVVTYAAVYSAVSDRPVVLLGRAWPLINEME
jgi:hypothetical protein